VWELMSLISWACSPSWSTDVGAVVDGERLAGEGSELALLADVIILVRDADNEFGDRVRISFAGKVILHQRLQIPAGDRQGIFPQIIGDLLIQIFPAELLVGQQLRIIALDLGDGSVVGFIIFKDALAQFDAGQDVLEELLRIRFAPVDFFDDIEIR